MWIPDNNDFFHIAWWRSTAQIDRSQSTAKELTSNMERAATSTLLCCFLWSVLICSNKAIMCHLPIWHLPLMKFDRFADPPHQDFFNLHHLLKHLVSLLHLVGHLVNLHIHLQCGSPTPMINCLEHFKIFLCKFSDLGHFLDHLVSLFVVDHNT